MLLLGCQHDLEATRVVQVEEGQELADVLGCPFIETSAKNDINVRESLLTILDLIEKDTVATNIKKDRTKSVCNIM